MNLITERRRRRIQGVIFKLPGMITCEVFEGFIYAYLEGTLPAPQRRLFEIHLKVCRSCRRYLSDYRKTLAATNALAADNKTNLENVPEDLIAAIIAARPPDND
ncbi:anti-sigma factor family protein [Tateyamaria sp.]|uniref:anti-sigma factor family protein n=1 Tax=Tateyamaria sp. TaxID=1929288 RepID=UPI0032A04518